MAIFKKILLLLLLVSLPVMPMGSMAQERKQVLHTAAESRLYQDGWLGTQPAYVSLQDTTGLEAEILNALKNLSEKLDIQKYNLTVNEAEEFFFSVVNKHPELFYISGGISVLHYVGSTKALQYSFSGTYRITDKNLIAQKNAAIEEEVEHILCTVPQNASKAEKALFVHDWFALHYAYDYANYLHGTVPLKSYRIDGLFVDKTAVCQGYALGYIYVLQKLGITAEYVTSTALNHGWNMVELDGKWYHTDVTWDDPVSQGSDQIGMVQHNNFMLSDADIMATGHNYNGLPVKVWESPHTASETLVGYWQGVRGYISYKDGNRYFMRENSIIKYDGTSETELLRNGEPWFLDGGYYYPAKYNCNVGVFKNRIYYNTPTEIRSIKLDGTEDSLFMAPNVGTAEICGLKIENDILYYCTAKEQQGNRTVQPGIELGFDFSARKSGENIMITTSGHMEPDSFFYIASYAGKELLELDVLQIRAGITSYMGTTAPQADSIEVFAFTGLLPKCEHKKIEIGG